MGWTRNMNQEEEKAVEELKMLLKDDLTPAMKEDATIYYRFLKARDFDIAKAEKMLRKNITWRKIYQADTIVQNFKPIEVFEKMMEPSLIGYDKDGDMVLYSPVGTFNIFDIYKSIKVNNLIKHLTWFGERHVAMLEEHNRKTGNCRYQATVIIDAEKLTLKDTVSKLTLDLVIRFVHMYQDNYPERMKFIYIINVPSYFIYLFSVLKNVMASTTVKKFHLYNHDGWKEHLLEFIDGDVLPAFLGGTRTDPDGNPRCRSFISPGGKIPEKYFLTNNDRYFENGSQVTKMTLSNQEKKEIRVDVAEAGLLLQWEFLVRNKDIGFGVFFLDSERKIQEVIPVQKYETSDGTEKDSYKCHSAGTCPQVTKLTLSNQEKKEIRVDVGEAGLLLQWEFLVRNKDIGFGVFFLDSERKIQEVIPVQKYETSVGTEKDSYKCHSAGTYIIIFDNSYSWMSSKTVEYSINVRKPSV